MVPAKVTIVIKDKNPSDDCFPLYFGVHRTSVWIGHHDVLAYWHAFPETLPIVCQDCRCELSDSSLLWTWMNAVSNYSHSQVHSLWKEGRIFIHGFKSLHLIEVQD